MSNDLHSIQAKIKDAQGDVKDDQKELEKIDRERAAAEGKLATDQQELTQLQHEEIDARNAAEQAERNARNEKKQFT